MSVLGILVYFCFVGLFTVTGLLLLIWPRKYVEVISLLNPVIRRSGSSLAPDWDPQQLRWVRPFGLGMSVMGLVMLMGPLIQIIGPQVSISPSPQPPTPPKVGFDWVSVVGQLFILSLAIYLFVKPRALLSFRNRIVPRHEVSKEGASISFLKVRIFLAIFMLVVLWGLIVLLRAR